jgi:protein-S-isoprenylcysteine O-methyltransferase Ste14
MKNVIRQIFSFVLPFTVLVVVPYSIEDNLVFTSTTQSWIGIAMGLIGLSMMATTIYSFMTIGKGTLAPWAPTQKLVVTGLYRYVRNPMISGVWFVLLGEATLFASYAILIWSGAFLVINTVYFILSEEPGLEKRFGESYRVYKKHVPRWIPRLTPYQPENNHNA